MRIDESRNASNAPLRVPTQRNKNILTCFVETRTRASRTQAKRMEGFEVQF